MQGENFVKCYFNSYSDISIFTNIVIALWVLGDVLNALQEVNDISDRDTSVGLPWGANTDYVDM